MDGSRTEGPEAGAASAAGRAPEPVRRLLERDERVLWLGRPEPARFAARRSGGIFLAGVAFAPFAIFWIYGMPTASVAAFVFQVLFAVVGLSLLSSPLWQFWRALRTTYVVTDRRLVILDGVVRDTVESYRPQHIDSVRLASGFGGHDTLVLPRARTETSASFHPPNVELVAVRRAREAERHIRTLIMRHRAPGG